MVKEGKGGAKTFFFLSFLFKDLFSVVECLFAKCIHYSRAVLFSNLQYTVVKATH